MPDGLRSGQQTVAADRVPERSVPLPSSPLPARSAAAVALVNVPLHLSWALGGTFLLPGGSSIADLAQTRVANAAVCVLLLIGAAVLLMIGGLPGRSRPGRGTVRGGRVVRAVLLTAIGAAAAVCVSHAVYGFATKALFLAGYQTLRFPDLGDGWSAAEKHTAAVLDLAVFEPWFLAQGVLLVVVGRQFLQTARGRRRWVRVLSLGTALLVVLGVVLAATGRTVTVG